MTTGLVLEWSGQAGDDVRVAGEFSNWLPEQTVLVGDKWVFTTNLKPGRYYYKWVIDGNWLVDESQQIEVDQDGNRNNVALVEEKQEDDVSNQKEEQQQQGDMEVVLTEKPEAADLAGESSGDSDSWERVSVEDCALPATEEQPAATQVEAEQEAKQEAKQEAEQEAKQEAKQESAAQPSEPQEEVKPTPAPPAESDSLRVKRKIERFFSPSPNFLDLMCGQGCELERLDYPVHYWDTPQFSLMKEGMWCKQFRDQWLLRKLEGNRMKTLEDKGDIEQDLEMLLGYKGNLEEYVEKTLTKQIHFDGAITRWELEGCEVEHLREGDFYTVNIRLEDSMVEGLNRIYALADKLNLNKLRLETPSCC